MFDYLFFMNKIKIFENTFNTYRLSENGIK